MSSSPSKRAGLPPRSPCASLQRKTSPSPEQTLAKVASSLGGFSRAPCVNPQLQPSPSNQRMLAATSETFRIGVIPVTFIEGPRQGSTSDSGSSVVSPERFKALAVPSYTSLDEASRAARARSSYGVESRVRPGSTQGERPY